MSVTFFSGRDYIFLLLDSFWSHDQEVNNCSTVKKYAMVFMIGPYWVKTMTHYKIFPRNFIVFNLIWLKIQVMV